MKRKLIISTIQQVLRTLDTQSYMNEQHRQTCVSQLFKYLSLFDKSLKEEYEDDGTVIRIVFSSFHIEESESLIVRLDYEDPDDVWLGILYHKRTRVDPSDYSLTKGDEDNYSWRFKIYNEKAYYIECSKHETKRKGEITSCYSWRYFKGKLEN